MLKLENIWFSVVENGVKKDILKNINIEIKDDEFVVITGPNGSGKYVQRAIHILNILLMFKNYKLCN